VFAVQDEIAEAVVRTLRVQLGADDEVRSTPSNNLEAYTSYLKGRHLWNKRTEPDLLKSLSFFQTACATIRSTRSPTPDSPTRMQRLGSMARFRRLTSRPRREKRRTRHFSLSDHMPEALTTLGCLAACMTGTGRKPSVCSGRRSR
jgi:hypothetical protein